MRICSLCNALQEVNVCCPKCGQVLLDGGPVEDYYGAYSPYVERDSLVRASNTSCVHLFYCAKCDFDTKICSSEVEI
jgi:hypothetical protein